MYKVGDDVSPIGQPTKHGIVLKVRDTKFATVFWDVGVVARGTENPIEEYVGDLQHYRPPVKDYCEPEDVICIRVYYEAKQWHVDGIDGKGGCTEYCASFDAEEDARDQVSQFRATQRIPDSAVVEYESEKIANKTAEIRRLFTKKAP